MEMNREQRRAAAKAKRHGYGQAKHSTRVIVDPVSFAVSGVKPMRDEMLIQTQLKHRQAFEAVRTGKAENMDARFLVEMVNMTEIYAQKEFGADKDMMQIVAKAQDAIKSANDRFKRTQRIGFAGLEMTAVEECLDLHEQIISLIPVASVERMLKEYAKRIEQMNKV